MMIYNNLNLEKELEENKAILSRGIKNQNVLVIGGAGSIGSSYIKAMLAYEPSKLVVVDSNENGLTELTRDLRSSKSLDFSPEYTTYPVNLLSSTFDKIFRSHNWDVVANFSAHKHVRSEKDGISVEALIKNNVFGIIKLLELCDTKPPKAFFSVSTDKAANPVNIMGASKSLMEKLILSRMNDYHVSTARFANVAFSNGSLLDGFVSRLEKKQPLSCPSDIRRFFVTAVQSGQICLLSTFLGSSGQIFFPKLDFEKDQIYFKDIALEFLRSKGKEPVYVGSEKEAKEYNVRANEIPAYFFKTDTSGEKECEEFFTEEENANVDRYSSLGFITPKDPKISFSEVLSDFNEIFDRDAVSKMSAIKVLKKYVPSFEHIEKGKNLDQKM